MNLKIKVAFLFLILLSMSGQEKKPRIILTDSYGRVVVGHGRAIAPGEREAIWKMDSLFASCDGLEANKRYSIRVVRSDGQEISSSNLTSNKKGIIPTCALWWDLGVKYNGRGVGEEDTDFQSYEYSCKVIQEGELEPILEKIIPISNAKKEPVIYSSDKDGNPKNIFIKHSDDVYITCKNLSVKNNEGKFYICVVKDRWYWSRGDSFEVQEWIEKELNSDTQDFTHLVWHHTQLETGSYDLIVTDKKLGIIYDNNDLIDSNYGMGFRVIKRNEEEEIIMDLACQAPPRLRDIGVIVEPHRPVYKDYFAGVEEVWVAVDPLKLKYYDENVRLYVINYKGEELSDGARLKDVSGEYKSVIIQPGSTRILYTLVWSEPQPCNVGYDVVVDFKPFGIYDKGRDIRDTYKRRKESRGGFYVPKDWVCLESVSFNHTPNDADTDAISIRRSKKEDVRVPEWRRGKPIEPVAYVIDNRVRVKAEFSASDDIFMAKIKAEKSKGDLGDLRGIDIYFDEHENYFWVRGDIPRRIKAFYQEWAWYLQGVELHGEKESFKKWEDIHIATTINKIYIVLDEPQNPWENEGEKVPWIRVLDLATKVAEEERDAQGAAEKITGFLYEKIGASYRNYSHYSVNNNVSSGFNLTLFLENIPQVRDVNCYDMAKALVIFSNVLGCDMDLQYFKPGPSSNEKFDFNWVQLVGGEWKNGEIFENHAFGFLRDKVFDALLKVGIGTQSLQPPPDSEPLINKTWDDYKEMLLRNVNIAQRPEEVIFEIEK